MNIVPFVHEGLGNSSYLIGLAEGSAILVDPDRTVQRYLDAAADRGWRIDSVLETHLHADFVSGAHELAAAMGATLFVPEGEGLRLTHHGVHGSERWARDGAQIEAVASPGHTPEHMSYVIRAASHPAALFSGGSLLVGGAARTDLIAPEMTDTLTRAQYRTLKSAFSALADETLLYPTHGGGSFCSAGPGGATRTSTLGAERAANPLLAFDDEDGFAAWFPTTFPSAPSYYFRMRAFNQAGPRLRRDIGMPSPLAPGDFEEAARSALIVDTRPVESYSAFHIKGSFHIPFGDSFAVWLGWLAPANTRLLFVAQGDSVTAIVDEALLVGYESFDGWLEGGIGAWRATGRAVASTGFVDSEAARRLIVDGADVVDVREPNEFARGHVPGARHVPLGSLPATSLDGADDVPVIVYCEHGERASTAASLLERGGRAPVNVRGGYQALIAAAEGAKA